MSAAHTRRRLILQKLLQLNWGLIGLALFLGGTGIAMLYSVAGGEFQPWAQGHLLRLAIGLGLMLLIALIDIRRWYQSAYLLYALLLALLALVELLGDGNGVNRWIRFGGLSLQPSELMRIGMLLALARYFHSCFGEGLSHPLRLLPPLALILVPLVFIVRQPDLGTAVLLALTGGAVLFAAGLSWRYIGAVVLGLAAALPVLWTQLRGYQRERILIFLEPERDPLGAGYHILQSKIAIGSGGLFGRGFLQGSQSQLDFLPEQQTDFIFTMFAEEMGFLGCLTLLLAYGGILGFALVITSSARSAFGRLLACGIGFSIFCYMFVNMAMVMGLVPVVGMPLPMISYGGTALITVMALLGLLMSVHLGRGFEMPARR